MVQRPGEGRGEGCRNPNPHPVPKQSGAARDRLRHASELGQDLSLEVALEGNRHPLANWVVDGGLHPS